MKSFPQCGKNPPTCACAAVYTGSMNQPSPSRHLQAQLTLGFARERDTTRLIRRIHHGPLRVQKPLYPEGSAICHAIIIHPPGGVVGGDQLAMVAQVGSGAQALLSTPGASKWYKANGHVSQQQINLEIAAGASLEWLPQESIFFDAADVRLQQTIHLAADARYIGWEILCFGRTASGERFTTGQIHQHTRIVRAGKPIWFEQGGVQAAGEAMRNPLGLAGYSVCATLLATGNSLNATQLQDLRQAVEQLQQQALTQATAQNRPPDAGEFGISQSKTMLVARHMGHCSELARHIMLECWRHVRPAMLGCTANVPRIWNT